MKVPLEIFLLLVILSTLSCDVETLEQRNQNARVTEVAPEDDPDLLHYPHTRQQKEAIISKNSLRFALDFDRALRNTRDNTLDNILFSPIGLYKTLAAIILATKGDTSKELCQLLGLTWNKSSVLGIVYSLLDLINENDERQYENRTLYSRKLSSGMFIDKKFEFDDTLKVMSKRMFQSEPVWVDFDKENGKTSVLITEWIRSRLLTRFDYFLPEPVERSTKVAIASTMYFDSDWNSPFDGLLTRSAFYIEPNQTVYVDMMSQMNNFLFYHDQMMRFSIIGLPYKGDEVTMYIILTTDIGLTALQRLKNRLTPDLINHFIKSMAIRRCIVKLPKMRFSDILMTRDALENLNISSLFDPASVQDINVIFPEFPKDVDDLKKPEQNRTNFSTVRHSGIYTDEIVHAIKMSFDQKGERIDLGSSSQIKNVPESLEYFTVNKPFLFFIRHNGRGDIWMWGSVSNPITSY